MDPIPEVHDDAEPAAIRPPVAPEPIDGVLAPEPVPVADVAAPDTGSLAETESLLGAVMAGAPDGEAASLRRTLELDDRPQTATPTVQEQVEQAAAQRRAVTQQETADPAGAIDPTEQYEVHDAALSGDPLAQAIDATASAQRAAQQQEVRAEQRDGDVVRREQVPGATDRATQDSGAAAVANFGAGRPPAHTDIDDESDEERIERVDRLAEAQRVRALRERGTDEG